MIRNICGFQPKDTAIFKVESTLVMFPSALLTFDLYRNMFVKVVLTSLPLQTICIIGRLTALNPAYILPSLRKTLMELLTEMEHSGLGRNKEQSAKMLGHLVANAPGITCTYVEPIMKVLVPKLRDEADHSPMVVTSVLRAVGDLSHVSGVLMKVRDKIGMRTPVSAEGEIETVKQHAFFMVLCESLICIRSN